MDPLIIVAFLVGAGLGVWAAIRESANAVLHGKRNWWLTAIHAAQHRLSHKKFKHDLARGYTGSSWTEEATAELERMRNKQQ